MDIGSGLIAIAAALAISISALGVGIGQGNAAASAMEAMARQPEQAGNLRTNMILALGLMEALAIYGLLIAFMLLSKI
jgi:F-type H+-transporting ATPase subunit c